MRTSCSRRSRTRYSGRPFTSSNTRPKYSPSTFSPISCRPPQQQDSHYQGGVAREVDAEQ